MNTRRIVPLVSAVGAVLLFGAWLVQATLVDRANDSLARVDAAQSVYQTYQSNNALFNSILASIADNHGSDYNNYPAATTQSYGQLNYETIRRLQVTNYELGLHEMETALDERVRRTIPAPASAAASDAERTERTQTRLEEIQIALAERRASLVRYKNRVYWIFFSIYVIGSLAIVVASVIPARG